MSHTVDNPNDDEQFERIVSIEFQKELLTMDDNSLSVISGGKSSKTEAAFAEFCCDRILRGKYVYVEYNKQSSWYRYEDGLWREECRETSVVEECRQFFLERARRTECDIAETTDQDKIERLKAILNVYIHFQRANPIRNVVFLARGIMCKVGDIFDQHPRLLCAKNGIIELDTGNLLPHSPEYYFTMSTECDYIPDKQHDIFDAVLSALTDDKRAWMQSRIAQAAYGFPPADDVTVFNKGGGSDGKTTFMLAIACALGGAKNQNNYGAALSSQILVNEPGSHTTAITDLRGRRFVYLEEADRDKELSAVQLKQVVGSAVIVARRMRQDNQSFAPVHSLFMNVNYFLRVNETDEGTWRRIILMEWPYHYVATEEEIVGPNDRLGIRDIKTLVQNDLGVHEAALAWIVRGCIEFHARDDKMLPIPPSVVNETHKWRALCDLIHGYVSERLVYAEDSIVIESELKEDFKLWMMTLGKKPWSGARFSTQFFDHNEIKSWGVERCVKRLAACGDRISRSDCLVNFIAPTKTIRGITRIRFRSSDEVVYDNE